jgi:acetylornithine deacetylase/succinyl-diaminopimelate desuccinylase-like protein
MTVRNTLMTSTIAIGLAMASLPGLAEEPALNGQQQLAEDILRELVEFESTEEHPEQTLAALEAMAGRLKDAGLPAEDVVLVNPAPGKHGLVARIRGIQDQRPLLTMAHIDVVTASLDDWAFPPYTFGKKEGYYFGRGTQDNKTGVAHLVTNFIRLQQENFVPNRDLIMMLTGDEETEGDVADWLSTEGKELIDAEFALNSDSGGGEYDEEFKPRAFNVQTSEKVYQTYQLTLKNVGGHSSIPRPDNAIYQLAQALVNISNYQFPVQIGPNTRLMFARSATLLDGQEAADMAELGKADFAPEAAQRLASDPYLNAIIRTTCVATELEAGHAENALPMVASATINCRIVPGVEPAEVLAKLKEVANDPAIEFTSIYDAKPSLPSVMPAHLQETLERLVEESWPGIPVLPEMSTGATDGLFVRNAGIPVFGVAGWFMRSSDIRAHGLDEKIGIAEFHEGTEFWYRMLKTLSQP